MKAATESAVVPGASGPPCSWPDRKLSKSDQALVDRKKAEWETIRATARGRVMPKACRHGDIKKVGEVVLECLEGFFGGRQGVHAGLVVVMGLDLHAAGLVGLVIDEARLRGFPAVERLAAAEGPLRRSAQLALMADRYADAGKFEFSPGEFLPARSYGWSPLLHKVFFKMAREWRSEMQKAKKQFRTWSPAARSRMRIDIWLADEWPRGAFKATCAELLERAPKLPGLKVTGKMLRERARELGLAWKTEPGPLVPPVG